MDPLKLIEAVGALVATLLAAIAIFYTKVSKTAQKSATHNGTREIITVLSGIEARNQASFNEIAAKHGILISRFDKLEVSVGLRLDRVEAQISSLQELHRMASQVEVSLAKIQGLEKEVDALRVLKHQMQNEHQLRMLRLQMSDLKNEQGRGE